jgi:gliding motility-associated-like protein
MGGEMKCDYLGNNKYRITTTIYQDCAMGESEAIAQDNPAGITVFDANTNSILSYSYQMASQTDLISSTDPVPCLELKPNSCVRRQVFVHEFQLAPGRPYLFAYQRCCHPYDLQNFKNPSDQGFTLFVFSNLNLNAPSNTGAAFKAPVPGFYCKGDPFAADLSAVDVDGDQLVYSLAPSYRGADPTNPKPNYASAPPYSISGYADGYSWQNPFGPDGSVSLNPQTGMLTGVCDKEGRYMIAVVCDEYRNGAKIGTSMRQYLYTIADCKRFVQAGISRDPWLNEMNADPKILKVQCGKGNTVQFTNTGKGATAYVWDFGDTNTNADTSALENPSYTYPGPGRYTVSLTAFNPKCIHTITGDVVIANDTVTADFIASGGTCLFDTLDLTDLSNSKGSPITSSAWSIDYVWFEGANNPPYFFRTGLQKLHHVVKTQNGCIASSSQDFNVRTVQVYAGHDTTIKNGTELHLRASGAQTYEWSDLSPGRNHIINRDNEGIIQCWQEGKGFSYTVIGKDGEGCRGIDTFSLTVTGLGYVKVPNAFTPNGDGSNDLLKVFLSDCNFEEFSVYNRQGNRVFISNDLYTGWDGRHNGSAAPTDVYLWMLKVKEKDGRLSIHTGNVTLLR